MVIVLITFSYDMGHIVMTSTGLHSSVAVAARAAARVGNVGPYISPSPCKEASWSNEGPAYSAFCESVSNLGLNVDSFNILSPQNDRCTISNVPNSPNSYVTVRASATVNYLTPGLASLVGLIEGGSATITSTSVARCEVAYDQ